MIICETDSTHKCHSSFIYLFRVDSWIFIIQLDDGNYLEYIFLHLLYLCDFIFLYFLQTNFRITCKLKYHFMFLPPFYQKSLNILYLKYHEGFSVTTDYNIAFSIEIKHWSLFVRHFTPILSSQILTGCYILIFYESKTCSMW